MVMDFKAQESVQSIILLNVGSDSICSVYVVNTSVPSPEPTTKALCIGTPESAGAKPALTWTESTEAASGTSSGTWGYVDVSGVECEQRRRCRRRSDRL